MGVEELRSEKEQQKKRERKERKEKKKQTQKFFASLPKERIQKGFPK